jgi:hypothetical protein
MTFNTKKIYLYDTIVVIVIFLLGGILYAQSIFSLTQLFLGVLGASILTLVITLLVFCKIRLFQYLKNFWISKLSLLIKIHKVVHKKYDTRMIDTIFTYFVHYYELYVNEISQDREFPKEEFPEGSYDLVKVYLYITQLRKRNLKLLNKVDFNKKNEITFFNMPFKCLKLKVSKNYELLITGDNEEDKMTFNQYNYFILKCEMAIYNLDTQIASWLIKNRNHFGF